MAFAIEMVGYVLLLFLIQGTYALVCGLWIKWIARWFAEVHGTRKISYFDAVGLAFMFIVLFGLISGSRDETNKVERPWRKAAAQIEAQR
jgi:hypothetical protein